MSVKLPDFDTLWDYSNPAKTEIKFRKLLKQAEKNGDIEYQAQLLTQIARTEGLQRKFDEAHITLNKVLGLLTVGNVTARIRYLLERGRVYNSSDQPGKAKPLFLEAYEEALMHNEDYHAIDAAHMLGIVGKGRESLKWNITAISLAESTKNSHAKKWLGALYNNTGWAFFDLKEFDIALDYFNRNIKWHKKRKSVKELIIARWCTARTLRAMQEVDEALGIHMQLLKEVKEKKLEQDGYIYEEAGECLLLLGREKESKKYFHLAYKCLSKDPWLCENEKPRLERLKKLGEPA
jgi:tetratricopeptide (TPR) repeat protein